MSEREFREALLRLTLRVMNLTYTLQAGLTRK
jgi:hypothetical protein